VKANSWLAPVLPTVAIEIATRRVTVVDVPAAGRSVAAYAGEGLPDGAVTPSLTGVNIRQPEVVQAALQRALERSGLTSTRRAALVVPDSIARVSLLTFDDTPTRAQDLDQLVHWQLRKAAPFPIEDAAISHFAAASDGRRLTVAAVLARRDVLAEYEAVVAALGIHAGVVDLASFNVMNAVMATAASGQGDWLLVHMAAEATTLAIVRGEALMFYRHRTAIDEETLGALVHQTAMYHEDRLGGSAFARVWLSGAGADAGDARREISGRLGMPVDAVDIRPAAAVEGPHPPSADVLDALAAPVGILVRDRRVA
jgi:Tfp pilus assembly PilM family ATPase